MGILKSIKSALFLTGLSLRRSVWSRQTAICAMLSFMAIGITYAWSVKGAIEADKLSVLWIMPVYFVALLPIYCLSYASGTISSERSDGTLVYLLTSSMHRPMIYASRFVAALLITMFWTFGTFALMTLIAKPGGRLVFVKFWPTVLLATMAYVSLFHLFSALFRRSTIIALLYAIFLEILFSVMPGTAKRITISFYTHCSLFEAGQSFDVVPASPEIFLPISGSAAVTALWIATSLFFVLGAWVFSRKEYV